MSDPHGSGGGTGPPATNSQALNAATSAVPNSFSTALVTASTPCAAGELTGPPVGRADLDAFRAEIGVPTAHTVAVARTDIPALEGMTFQGASPLVRAEAGLGPAQTGPIASPISNPL